MSISILPRLHNHIVIVLWTHIIHTGTCVSCGCYDVWVCLTEPPGWWLGQSWWGHIAEHCADSGSRPPALPQYPHSLGSPCWSSMERTTADFVQVILCHVTHTYKPWNCQESLSNPARNNSNGMHNIRGQKQSSSVLLNLFPHTNEFESVCADLSSTQTGLLFIRYVL